MNFIEELRQKRLTLLNALDANEGDINLRIFEDFYPDEAHFLYELLQNAEDAEATEAYFELNPEGCVFEHNGLRHFTEEDIRSITGIFNSGKRKEPDKIGKFGVGFKSVFVYTDTPVIYSKTHSFRIERYILPAAVAPRVDLGDKTRFEFPFDGTKKSAKVAYAEVKSGLGDLAETTLLFLRNIRTIEWRIGNHSGAVLRRERSDNHIEIVRRENGRDTGSSHWLRLMAPVTDVNRFAKPADGVERQHVAVAFRLEFTGEKEAYDSAKPLKGQMKIVPAKPGNVSVYFPAAKETSGLRFHLHAPFVPELSRASVKNSPENAPLFEQLARLLAKALHGIKDVGLLSSDFLGVLPNNDEEIPERYQVIRDAIIAEMKREELVPTQAGAHAPAKRLVQGPAGLKRLLSDEDLAFLLGRADKPTWAIATQKNSNIDKFLSSLLFAEWNMESWKELLEERTQESKVPWREGHVDPALRTWMNAKSDEWHQLLYALLNKHLEDEDDADSLADCMIVRLQDGGYCSGVEAFFPTGADDSASPFRRVAAGIVGTGSRKGQQLEAYRFLEKVGVRVPGEREEIEHILMTRYGHDSEELPDDQYLADLKGFITFAEHNPDEKELFGDKLLFRTDDPEHDWADASCIYLDAPYGYTGLAAFHESVKASQRERWSLSGWYGSQQLGAKKFAAFAEWVGCERTFVELIDDTVSCADNENWHYLRNVDGSRYANPIDQDYAIPESAEALLQTQNMEYSRLAWSTMCAAGEEVLTATYQKSSARGARHWSSQLVHQLSIAEWVPLRDGSFVAPRRASRETLASGLQWQEHAAWLEAIQFGADTAKSAAAMAERAKMRQELGFESEEDLSFALEIAKLSRDVKEEVLALVTERKRARAGMPTERTVGNRELRAKRVQEQADETPLKASELRTRAVRVGYGTDKAEVKQYLQDQYTDEDGVMLCQACRSRMPFKLPGGDYYFEAVEILEGAPKLLRESFLALCPNHAAMYRYANGQRGQIQELLNTADGTAISMDLGGSVTTVYFTETHLQDVRACFSSLGGKEAGRQQEEARTNEEELTP